MRKLLCIALQTIFSSSFFTEEHSNKLPKFSEAYALAKWTNIWRPYYTGFPNI